MAIFEEALILLVIPFEFLSLNAQQKSGIGKLVEERKDVFVNLPTGSGTLSRIKRYHSCLILPHESLIISSSLSRH